MKGKKMEPISARPVKSFFVEMLTRDMELNDAILDLLDNCVDGVQRSTTKTKLREKQPYKGYWSKIKLSSEEFSIEDNCGGIPWALRDYAFRMGRLKSEVEKGRRMIGTYGIGMKRAIFKMGTDCTIETRASDGAYRLRFSPQWMSAENDWDLEPEKISVKNGLGTTIQVTQLRPNVREHFKDKRFSDDLYTAVATHYAYIIEKGFKVTVNGRIVEPKRIRLLYSKSSDQAAAKHKILPFIYEGTYKGVNIFLAVGFTGGIPDEEEADASFEDYKERYSSADAGWTIVCNDRIVVYCDKTALTGWGISGVPQYHMQFIAISGIVVFSSDDARLLPMTTTKRGLEGQSELYLHVKDKMIEGMKIFTSYTNAWKRKELVSESRYSFTKTSRAELEELREMSRQLKMSSTRGGVLSGRQYRPVLPRPTTDKEQERITFTRPAKEVRSVSKYLFGTPDKRPSEVGDECFRLILEEAS